MTPRTNRRRHPRFAAAIECKLLRRAVSRYDTARTGDVSAGGAMLEVFTTRPIREGEQLEVAVNWGGRPIMLAGEMIRARVRRAGPVLGRTQLVAIEFDRAQEQADALAGAEAA